MHFVFPLSFSSSVIFLSVGHFACVEMLWPLDCDDSVGLRLLDFVFERSIDFFCQFDLIISNNLVSEALRLIAFPTTARPVSEYFLNADSTLFWRHRTVLLRKWATYSPWHIFAITIVTIVVFHIDIAIIISSSFTKLLLLLLFHLSTYSTSEFLLFISNLVVI